MPGHGNFTSLTLGGEGAADALKVNGETTQDVDLVRTILVVITPKDVAQTLLSSTEREEGPEREELPSASPSASVALPAGQSRWTATFPNDQALFGVNDTLLLTGVMTSEDAEDAFVWQQALAIAPDKAPARVA
jgi:hypothetical protein